MLSDICPQQKLKKKISHRRSKNQCNSNLKSAASREKYRKIVKNRFEIFYKTSEKYVGGSISFRQSTDNPYSSDPNNRGLRINV